MGASPYVYPLQISGVISASLSFLRIRQKIFSENVVQQVLHHLLGAVGGGIETALLEGFGVIGSDRKDDDALHALFEEEETAKRTRRDLLNRGRCQQRVLTLVDNYLRGI